jgi:hypothetical protein
VAAPARGSPWQAKGAAFDRMSNKQTPPPGRRFVKGQSGNPGGKPSTAWFRDWLAKPVKDGAEQTRREAYMSALFLTALDRKHRNHVDACELLAAYDFGKPIQGIDVKATGDRVLNLAVMSTDELWSMRSLLGKATGSEGE